MSDFHCVECGDPIDRKPTAGTPPKYCSGRCRSRGRRGTGGNLRILERVNGLTRVGDELVDANGDFVMCWYDTATELLDYIRTGKR